MRTFQKKCPCKGRITLLAPYRGNGVGMESPLVGPRPYPNIFDPFRVYKVESPEVQEKIILNSQLAQSALNSQLEEGQ